MGAYIFIYDKMCAVNAVQKSFRGMYLGISAFADTEGYQHYYYYCKNAAFTD